MRGGLICVERSDILRERFDRSMPGDLPNIGSGIHKRIRTGLPGLLSMPRR
jgi:hypothetical protein